MTQEPSANESRLLRARDESSTPLVSVIMATYNCSATLQEALDSLVVQTYENWELIVCDDASTDSTLSILERFTAADPERVVLLRNRTNQKLAASLNRCLEVASGEYVARMDGDDRCVPERLERQVEFLQTHPDIDVVGTAMQRFDANGPADILMLQLRPDKWSLRNGVPFAHATVVARKSVYDRLGGYTVARRTERGQDVDLWFRFFAQGFSGANLPDPLYWVREDSGAIRRRTFTVRFHGFRTSVIGFRLLDYPKSWYIRPTVALLKGIVPTAAILQWRRFQAWSYRRSKHQSRAEQGS